MKITQLLETIVMDKTQLLKMIAMKITIVFVLHHTGNKHVLTAQHVWLQKTRGGIAHFAVQL